MWKYIKGTEKDFEGLPEETQYILKGKYWGVTLSYKILDGVLYVHSEADRSWDNSVHNDIETAVDKEEAVVIAHRTQIEESLVETKQEEQQTLPTKEQMNPAKDLPKIKLDVKKPIFDKGDDKEVKFIYSNNIYSVFELTDGDIFCIESSKVDTYFYNKPDVKTTEQLISDAWTYARNDGSLWASPTQLYYIAIKELIKHGVIDVSKTHEVPDDTTK